MEEKPYKGFVIWHLLWSNLGVRPLRSALSVAGARPASVSRSADCGPDVGRIVRLAHARRRSGRRHHRAAAQLLHFLRVFQRRDARIAGRKRLPACRESTKWRRCLIVVDQQNLGVVYGIDYDRFAGLSNGFTFLSGGPFQQPDQAIADDLAAQSRKLRVGQKRDCFSATNSRFPASCSTAKGRAFLFRSKRRRILPAPMAASRCFMCAARATPKARATSWSSCFPPTRFARWRSTAR